MNIEAKKKLFWWYIDNTPAEKIKPLEDITIEYLLELKLGGGGEI